MKSLKAWNILLALGLACAHSVSAVAALPESAGYLIWGPHAYHISSLDGVMSPYIMQISDYVKYKFEETSTPNGAPSVCTLASLRNRLETGKGVVLYAAHGGGGSIDWCAIDTFGTDEVACNTKLAEYEVLYPGKIAKSSFEVQKENGPETHYFLKVHSSVTMGWCTTFHPTRHGISFVFSCGTQGQGYNCFNSGVSFGYADLVNALQAGQDIDGIFSRMIADTSLSTYPAYVLYADPNPPTVGIYGGSVYLCPTLIGCAPSGPVGRPGYPVTLAIMFNSYMDTTIPASSLVSVSGVQVITQPWWVFDQFGLSTTLRVTCYSATPTSFTVTVSGEAKSKMRSGSLYLDGNRVAPNRDSYTASYSIAN